ncbi:hypothetical protein PMG11_03216 [Penicillium brasilianum]|uniref:Mei2-like C-terminal RNA recognition motif domain-containing protein n=1 Tax=Penicillium brasilianum TaxID=104259 RepID=A0A0F7VEY4_PENBI|nr:hypothetical protein PMG11_03216 [Penicillium brasilianum]
MSDNHPGGFPPISGLGPQGSSMPPENVHLPTTAGSPAASLEPQHSETRPAIVEHEAPVGSPSDPLQHLDFDGWKARNFRATVSSVQLPDWVTAPLPPRGPPHPLGCLHLPDSENPYVVDQALGPQSIGIPPVRSRLSLYFPPPGLPNPYVSSLGPRDDHPSSSQTPSGALQYGSQGRNTLQTTGFDPFAHAHPDPGPISRLHGHPNPYAPSLEPLDDHPSSSQALSGASLHGAPATNIRQSTNYDGPSYSHRGLVSRQFELPGPYPARDPHSWYSTSSNAGPYEVQGMRTPHTTRIDRSGTAHFGPVLPPPGIASSHATFDAPSESQSTHGVWPRRTRGTDAIWTPTPNRPDSTRRVLTLPPGVLQNLYATRDSPVQYQASSTTLPHGHHTMDIHQIASFDRPGPAYPQPGHTVRNLAPPDLGDTRSNRPGDIGPNRPGGIGPNRPGDIRPSRPGRFRGGAAPQARVERHVSRPPKEIENPTRHYLVRGIDTDVESWTVLAAFELFTSTIGPFLTELNTKGQIHIGFDDAEEATQAVALFSNFPEWEIRSLSKQQFDQQTRFAFPMPQDLGDTVFATLYCGPHTEVVSSSAEQYARQFLAMVGPIRSIRNVTSHVIDDTGVARFYQLEVRYHMVRSAYNAIKALNGVRLDGLKIEVMPYADGTHFATSTRARTDSEQTVMARETGQRAPRAPGHRPGNNVISMDEILSGHDVRTAVMCRNIPHGMVWRELKAILDLSSAGRYNYLYLRINFGANVNVGYAFINFKTPADLAVFVRARVGRIWPGFEQFTGRIAEFTYADVQGFDTLVERFRNSPVMLNLPDRRPKLFHTQGPKTGEEAVFPQVNNFYTLAAGVHRSQTEAGLH